MFRTLVVWLLLTAMLCAAPLPFPKPPNIVGYHTANVDFIGDMFLDFKADGVVVSSMWGKGYWALNKLGDDQYQLTLVWPPLEATAWTRRYEFILQQDHTIIGAWKGHSNCVYTQIKFQPYR